MTTMADLLAAELRREPGRPFLTWYDETTGERVELSVTTYANWVAKTASLLVEEHELEKGDTLLVDLPAHWLGPVFLGAAWSAGLVVAFPATEPFPGAAAPSPAAVVCGPAGLDRWAPLADELPVLACSLLPMGVRFAEPLPAGVHDVGVEVWGQPDAFTAWDPPSGDDAALVLDDGSVTQDELWSPWSTATAGRSSSTGGDRLLTVANPASPPGVATFVEPLVTGGSLVLVSGAEQPRLDAVAQAERTVRRVG
ncbi:TIGR03089 family protein [Nocardioides sp. YIM 123512]|uniref:TIGR03089 family protein n=2 Tax=Nocardioides flavescens TaxID=2691959 RepID=A0A6L7F0J3_9ACTN|nr:TIGR03089 family protein [Nocardioides flavescens]